MLPSAVDNLKFAKTEVASVAERMGSTFFTFKQKGNPTFQLVAWLYRTLWVTYFFIFGGCTVSVLLYGFWASGWFSGPDSAGGLEDYVPPNTCWERVQVCCQSCNAC